MIFMEVFFAFYNTLIVVISLGIHLFEMKRRISEEPIFISK